RATATVQARIALEETLARKSQEAADAARRAAEAERMRASEQEKLKATLKARAAADRGAARAAKLQAKEEARAAAALRERRSNAWLPLSAAVLAVAALAVTAVLYSPSAPRPAALEEPLKLRLEPVLGSYKG
ncbi:MAG TPA: hypothetical protein VFA98_16170, partial [Thermoanaerobaculia bacterium]|nr:hypothetical protein [Thermoanaerobaculia bacterium]